MNAPLVTLTITTHDRPAAVLRRAVDSALAQTLPADRLEIVVVDDASPMPVPPVAQERVVWHRLERNAGCAGARNVGARLGKGAYLAFLDDDDALAPRALETLLGAIRGSHLPEPVAAVGARRDVRADGTAGPPKYPVSQPRGRCYQLEPRPKGRSYFCKQTLLVPRPAFERIGGFDPGFAARNWTDLALRLNEVCSIQGTDAVLHDRHLHAGPRNSASLAKRKTYFERLVEAHRARLEARPEGFARLLVEHAANLEGLGDRRDAARHLTWALRVAPVAAARLAAGHALRRRLSGA